MRERHSYFFELRKLSFALPRSLLSLAEVQMALLTAGRPRPSELMGAWRDNRGRSHGKIPSATDRPCRSSPPLLLVSPPFSRPLSLLPAVRCQRRGGDQRASLLVTLATAAAAASAGSGDSQQQPQTFRQRLAAAEASKKKKPPLPARLLSSFLATSTVPYR